MDTKVAIAVAAALVFGAVCGGVATAKYYPASDDTESASTPNARGNSAELDAALKDVAEARTEAAHWQSQYERLEKELNRASGSTDTSTEIVEGVIDSGEGAPQVMDAAMLAELEEYRERDRARQEREEERDERNAERRADWARMQTEMLNRRTDMFTELIERTDDPAEQQRWADIERNMTLGRDLMRDMREADTDEERAAVRDALRQNYDTMQSLLKQQQTAVLRRALEAEGIDTSQVDQIQRAVNSSLQDEAYRMTGGGGPPGGGRGWGGPRGGFGGGDRGGGRGAR